MYVMPFIVNLFQLTFIKDNSPKSLCTHIPGDKTLITYTILQVHNS